MAGTTGAAEALTDAALPFDPSSLAGSLHARARLVLEDNWQGASTVPSRSLYPHQWSWDSAFVAIGLRHLSPLRAQTELRTLFSAQWDDGRIPHIVFNPAVPHDAYFPSPDFWRSTTAGRPSGAPPAVQTSGIVQPPVHALAVWLTHRADPGLSRTNGFLRRAYPKLVSWHNYLLRHRDLGAGGLVSVVHPWEQGMDNSPCWDPPLSRVTPAPAGSFTRADLAHGAPEDRPTDLDYGRYVKLAMDYRDRGYVDGGGEFAVEDPAFNALLIASEHALGLIETELGIRSAARHARAARLTRALVDRLWDERHGAFLCRDVLTGELIEEHGVASLIPLILPALDEGTARALVGTLCGPRFGLGSSTRLVPSYDLTGACFDPHRYWRGPAWFNVGWLMEHGLRLHGHGELAAALREALLTTAGSSDFAEYVDPYTGEACGAREFSWTAALTLDLLHRSEEAFDDVARSLRAAAEDSVPH
ncbi:MGH1-like glycoside hydrolase domain-containing protein [Streptomyces chilikensis]|uniref:Mannosylglycerate hydrolase MGH1-like glycoside hydrolase domain-containing protein n=1 Tax=Streptomyces chilikensis TaxID=1194079 RepID=A0ABV3EPV9_9ACTN